MKTIIYFTPFVLFLGACSLLVEFEDEKKTPTERICDDGRDNDGDGFTDCDDQDCEFDEACGAPNANNMNNVYNNFNNNVNNQNNIIGPEICDDGEDNDGDGLYDCDDLDDCAWDPFCAPSEECFDDEDNDGDGAIDCRDPDCWGNFDCDRAGEHECGDGVDNEPGDQEGPEGDGLVDCMDPECEMNPICSQNLVRCDDTIAYTINVAMDFVYYFSDIYQMGFSSLCSPGQYCTIRPEVSRIPHCFPSPGTSAVPAYGVCGPTQKCGTGLVCARSDTISTTSDVCLPLCAPGHVNTCIGNLGICYQKMDDVFDGWRGERVETWLCDQPACDPMAADGTLESCQMSTSTCIPTTDLMGGAFCHQTVGTYGPGSACVTDHDCIRGHVCRQIPGDAGKVCHALCRISTDCGNGAPCFRADNRQFFGLCN